jgi:hypothetical protein
MEDVLITIITDVMCSDEYAEKPESAVIQLTAKDWERIKHLAKVVKDNKAHNINEYEQCWWFDKKPAFTFDELGDKFIVEEGYGSYEYHECGEETDPDAEFQFDRMDTELLVVGSGTFYFIGYGKWSGCKYETQEVTLKAVEEELAKPEATPRRDYYFNPDPECTVKAPALEDLPKYLNDENFGLQVYAREMCKKGGSSEGNH